MNEGEWDSLDAEARANLSDKPNSLAEFGRYKQRLRADGHAWKDDARDILAGFIWGEIEESSEDE